MAGYRRTAADRGRGQAAPFTADDLAAVLATCPHPRRSGDRVRRRRRRPRPRGCGDRRVALHGRDAPLGSERGRVARRDRRRRGRGARRRPAGQDEPGRRHGSPLPQKRGRPRRADLARSRHPGRGRGSGAARARRAAHRPADRPAIHRRRRSRRPRAPRDRPTVAAWGSPRNSPRAAWSLRGRATPPPSPPSPRGVAARQGLVPAATMEDIIGGGGNG